MFRHSLRMWCRPGSFFPGHIRSGSGTAPRLCRSMSRSDLGPRPGYWPVLSAAPEPRWPWFLRLQHPWPRFPPPFSRCMRQSLHSPPLPWPRQQPAVRCSLPLRPCPQLSRRSLPLFPQRWPLPGRHSLYFPRFLRLPLLLLPLRWFPPAPRPVRSPAASRRGYFRSGAGPEDSAPRLHWPGRCPAMPGFLHCIRGFPGYRI